MIMLTKEELDKKIQESTNAARKKVKIVRDPPNTVRCIYSYNAGRRNRGETLEEYMRGGKRKREGRAHEEPRTSEECYAEYLKCFGSK